MKFQNFLTVVLIYTLLILTVKAQTKIKTETNADIVEYTTSDGLPMTNFTNIVQTKDGYIWLSGVEGVYRFDGYDFDEVGKEYGVPEAQNIYYDSTKNMLYFASPEKFILYDGKNFTVFTENEGYKLNGLSGQQIDLLRADSKGRIWIGSSTMFVDSKFNGGLTMFENGKFTVYDSTSFPLHNALNFIETPYGDLIFNSRGKNTQTGEDSYIALFKDGKFKRIDESEGVYLQNAVILSQNLVTSIDKNGNTWISFTGILAPTRITAKDKQNTSGVLMYDGADFHQYPELNKLKKLNRLPISVEYSKTLDKLFLTTISLESSLFDSGNKSILEFKNGKWIFSDFFTEVKIIKNLKTDKKINDFKYSSVFYTKANKYFPELLVFTSITSDILQSSMYKNQYFKYSENSWQKFDAFNGILFSEIKDGAVLNTPKGFAIYYPNKSVMLTKKDGLLEGGTGIPFLEADRNGIIWISYSYTELPAYADLKNSGLNIWDGKTLHAVTEKDGLKSNTTFHVYQDTQFRIWITTSKGVTAAQEIQNGNGDWLFKFNNIKNSGKEDYNVTDILETKSGEIYAWQNFVRPAYAKITSADFYLGKYDGEKFVEIESPFSEEDKSKRFQMINLKETLDGKIWVEGLFADNMKNLTSVGTKILLYDGKTWTPPPHSWEIPEEQLHYVGTLKNGMYFLTVQGFYNFNGKKFVDLSDSVDANADFRILKEASVTGTLTNIQADERLYIRLRGRGLVIFDGTHLNFYTKKNGLPSADISNPLVDHNGNVLFSFPSGSLIVNGEKFQAYYNDENIISGSAYGFAKDINGNLALLYQDVGLYIQDAANKSFPLKISSVSIDTANFYDVFPKEFSHNQNSLAFYYAALNYKNPRQTKYEHYLKGYDKGWSRRSEAAFSQYQNLPPGSYEFKVKGITSNAMETNEASYSFVIYPPVWKTWQAYAFYVLFGFGFLYWVRKIELNRQRKNIEIKESQLRAEAAELQAKAAEAQSQLIQADNERKTQELEEARELQLSMLPKELPRLPNIDIAVYMKTATEVGGDYYDFHIHLDGTFTIVLGDATGHGMQAGMMVMIMKSLFMSDRSNKELLSFYNSANSALKDMRLGRLMMALTSVQFNGNKIRYINAGMPPILIFNKKRNIAAELTAGSMPLGAMKTFPYSVEESQLESGDTLLLLSDGLPELTNNNNKMYGYEKVRSEFHSVGDKEPEEIVEYLKNSAFQWNNGKDPDDDVTFIAVKIK